MSRVEIQRDAAPQVVADVRMYETADGGRATPAEPGWGCPVMVSNVERLTGFDALPLLRDKRLNRASAGAWASYFYRLKRQ